MDTTTTATKYEVISNDRVIATGTREQCEEIRSRWNDELLSSARGNELFEKQYRMAYVHKAK